jgi:predicted CoA-substrate-specific enzyme activase
MLTAGIDVGSTTTKAVLWDEKGLCAFALRATGIDIPQTVIKVISDVLDAAQWSLNDIDRIVATGYGRISIPFEAKTITEITCNAAGVRHLFPRKALVADIGGQDSKAIKLDQAGRVVQFAMNDRCAAGTGKFLEVAAQTLQVKVEEMGPISLAARNRIVINNTCTVFAQSEIVSLIAQKACKEDIAAVLHESIASRMVGLINSVNPDPGPELVLTGGVAQNIAIVTYLGKMLGRQILVPLHPQITTAMGAAILARDV